VVQARDVSGERMALNRQYLISFLTRFRREATHPYSHRDARWQEHQKKWCALASSDRPGVDRLVARFADWLCRVRCQLSGSRWAPGEGWCQRV